MAKPRPQVSVTFGRPEEARREPRERPAGAPFVLGVIGDFSGRGGSEDLEARLAEKVFFDVDQDGIDALLGRLAPEVRLDLPFARRLRLGEWEDFHPDAVAERLPQLCALRDARHAVGDPARMRRLLEQANAEVEPETPARPTPAPRPAARDLTAAGEEVLEAILGGDGADRGEAPAARRAGSAIDRLIDSIGEAAADRTDYALQDRWREAIDAELSDRVRQVIHHPAFRALEARWRGLRDLVRAAETGEGLRIRVLDLAAEDLAGELEAHGDDPAQSVLYRLVVEAERGTPGGTPFGLLVCDYALGSDDGSLRVLRGLARLAEQAGAPLLAEAAPDLSGIGERVEPPESDAWRELRALPGARALALCCPRVLARLPYGEETLPAETFAFEECSGPDPGGLLWASPVFRVAAAALAAVARSGSLAGLPPVIELPDLPLHVWRHDGEVAQAGPTRRLLTDAEIGRLVDHGLVPVAALRGSDEARVPTLQSLAGSALVR